MDHQLAAPVESKFYDPSEETSISLEMDRAANHPVVQVVSYGRAPRWPTASPMPRKRTGPVVMPEGVQGSSRYLWQRLVVLDLTPTDFARLLDKKGANYVAGWFAAGEKPTRPLWENLPTIAKAREVTFDELRVGVGYPSPHEALPVPTDEWELTSQRLSRQLLHLLRRVPVAARQGVSLTVAAALGALAQELERLLARDQAIDAG